MEGLAFICKKHSHALVARGTSFAIRRSLLGSLGAAQGLQVLHQYSSKHDCFKVSAPQTPMHGFRYFQHQTLEQVDLSRQEGCLQYLKAIRISSFAPIHKRRADLCMASCNAQQLSDSLFVSIC